MLLHNENKYVIREDLDIFFKNIEIKSRDPIQAINKTEQWGLKRGPEKGKYWIPYPYNSGVKHLMRKDFNKNIENKSTIYDQVRIIKDDIKRDYLDIPEELSQFGHKNPNIEDNTLQNLVLQPPVQAKYRDKYIFIDTLTRIPTVKTLIENDCKPYTDKELYELYKYLEEKFSIENN